MRLLAPGLLLTLLIAGCRPDPQPEPLEPRAIPPGVQVSEASQQVPDFILPQLFGDSLSMQDLAGDVLLVNFWATWCGPCRVEIPDLIELHEELKPQGFQVIGILLEEEDPNLARSFHEQVGINYVNLLDNDGAVGRAFGGVYSLPATFVIDRKGEIKHVVYGIFPINAMRPELEALLAAG